MRVEYSKRAVADLRKAAADSRQAFGPRVAAELEAYIVNTVTRIADAPESAPRVVERSGVRMVSLIRYPYKIFYRVLADGVRILHLRHTARRPWTRTIENLGK